jgi:hypothetical protein
MAPAASGNMVRTTRAASCGRKGRVEKWGRGAGCFVLDSFMTAKQCRKAGTAANLESNVFAGYNPP